MARFTPFTHRSDGDAFRVVCVTQMRGGSGEGTRCGQRSNARALSLARKAVDLCNCWRREAAAECLVEKQVELVSFGEDPIMVVATHAVT